MSRPQELIRAGIRRHMLFGLTAALVLVGGIGGWAASTELEGAVIATGRLVVESHVKEVKHPNGGVVADVLVKNGDRVASGDLLIRFDETLVRANLTINVKVLNDLAAQRARLTAERDGADDLMLQSDLIDPEAPEVQVLLEAQRRLFQLRSDERNGLKAQLRGRIGQLEDEISGRQVELAAKRRESEFVHQELEGIRGLYEKKLVPFARLSTLERDATRLDGAIGQLIAAIAQAKGRITETKQQIIQVDQTMRSEVAEELQATAARESEYAERKVAAEEHLRRVAVRAPTNGIVQDLSVHIAGAVVGAGEKMLTIVPDEDELTVEAMIRPQDIDQVRIGQPATLQFSAFNMRTTPAVQGRVTRVSADLMEDRATGTFYYLVRVNPEEEQQQRLGDRPLVPGMPVEVFIKTGARTALSFFTKPLTDNIRRAFREE